MRYQQFFIILNIAKETASSCYIEGWHGISYTNDQTY